MRLSLDCNRLAQNSLRLTKKRSVQVSAAGGLCLLLSTLALTNPSKEDYVSYTAERIHLSSKQGCQELDQRISVMTVSMPTADLCKSFVKSADLLGRGFLKQAINVVTKKRDNYLIFSIYTTTVPGRQYKTLGIGSHFFTFSAK
ncbi:DUF4359 domain-containing protein [Sphaerothrix gracilis]|uniref:DUF4359 domain-containing protein n=1 Tax=Sphaerothrix gracilis TaxID=3151835 RepID=UPI003D15F564